MNYRHAFHAGNFGDVLKHAVLVRMLVHLRGKPAAFRVLDTHAGAGLYDLRASEAERSGEWRDGIGRLFSAKLGEGAGALLAPYLDAVAALNPAGELIAYPGSPAVVRAFLRAQDRLTACELEPNAAAALAHYLAGDRRSKALAIDGWTALNAYLPPKERRGLVLVDPPFEDAGDFPRLLQALAGAHRKWASGTYLAWYPIKERAASDALARQLSRGGIAKILRVELAVAAPPARAALASEASGQRGHFKRGLASEASGQRGHFKRGLASEVSGQRGHFKSGLASEVSGQRGHFKSARPGHSPEADSSARAPGRLGACGLIVVNPPWTLVGELKTMLPALAAALSGGSGGSQRIDWLTGEK